MKEMVIDCDLLDQYMQEEKIIIKKNCLFIIPEYHFRFCIYQFNFKCIDN